MMPILVKDDDIRSGTKAKAHHGGYRQQGSQWVKLIIFPCQNVTFLILYLAATCSLLKFTYCHSCSVSACVARALYYARLHILIDILLYFPVCCFILLLGICLFPPCPAIVVLFLLLPSCSCLTLASDRLHGSWCNPFLEHNPTHALLISSLMSFYSSYMLRSCRG